MAQVNFAKGEVQCKVVYYGPAHAGKTANLRSIHARSPEHVRGQLTSIATDGNRTLFFDYLPLNLGKVAGIRTKLNIYAVPYLERQNALRLLVLEGVDGIVFVADSSRARVDENREALENLRTNLAAVGRDLSEIPLVFQWNKSDAADAMTAEEMVEALDAAGHDSMAAAATDGTGVLGTLKVVTRHALERLSSMMDAPAAGLGAAAPLAAPFAGIPEPTLEPSLEPALEPALESEPAADPEAEQPIFRPAWHRQAPKEDTSTHSALTADLQHRPLASVVHGARPQGEESAAPTPPPPVDPDEPLELARPATNDPEPPRPPDFVLEQVDALKNREREAEAEPQWQDTPPSDPFVHAESAGKAFPAFGGGMAPVSPHDDEEDERMVTVGGGGSRGGVRTIRQKKDSWDPEPLPESIRRPTGRPVADRRRRPRAQWRASPPPMSQMVAGVMFTLLWLAATGYLVKELL